MQNRNEEQKKIINNIGNEEYRKIVNFNRMDNKKSKYYNLSIDKYKKYSSNKELINQIIQRRLNEEVKNWTLALNHMANEFKTICYLMCRSENMTIRKEKDFEVTDIKNYFVSKKIDNSLIIQVTNLFDRRNNNGVSHSNGKEVLETEYFEYKNIVCKCIEILHK